jgi:hypothetical protein
MLAVACHTTHGSCRAGTGCYPAVVSLHGVSPCCCMLLVPWNAADPPAAVPCAMQGQLLPQPLTHPHQQPPSPTRPPGARPVT